MFRGIFGVILDCIADVPFDRTQLLGTFDEKLFDFGSFIYMLSAFLLDPYSGIEAFLYELQLTQVEFTQVGLYRLFHG
jgi:hypothetical protein